MLGSEITQAGVAVFDALQGEPELREARHRYVKQCQYAIQTTCCAALFLDTAAFGPISYTCA